MKGLKKLTSLIMVSVMALSLVTGCTNSNTTKATTTAAAAGETTAAAASTTAAGSQSTGAVDFYIFNTKGENADALQAAVDAYSAETG